MGKSEGNGLYLIDDEKTIRKKVMRAVTDSGPTEQNSTVTEPVQNLFTLMEIMSKPDTLQFFKDAYAIIEQLNGGHLFLTGSHDRWLSGACYRNSGGYIWEETIKKQHIVVCHYAMRVWSRSHYGSWQLYGHSHGGLPPVGKQHDIGVDNNDFYPVSFDKIVDIMKDREDSFNLIRK